MQDLKMQHATDQSAHSALKLFKQALEGERSVLTNSILERTNKRETI